VDGTLIEARASQKSFQRKDGGSEDGESFHGDRRSNQTQESKTDPDAKLYRKSSGSEARLSYLGHTLVENRSGLIVATYLTEADGHAERDAALLIAYQKRRRNSRPMTLGADKAYDTQDFVAALRDLKITPHVAQNDRHRTSAIDGRNHPAHQLSDQPSQALLGGEALRLNEIGWAVAEGEITRPQQGCGGCSPSQRRRSTSGGFRSWRRQHVESISAGSIGIQTRPRLSHSLGLII